MSVSIAEKAIRVLERTNDGNDLSPLDLKLVEITVNGFVNEEAEKAFYELCYRVENGYQRPWFHGIENLSIDHEGYIYWKGHQVEHYESPWAHSEKAKTAAMDLASRCQHLEAIGVEVTCGNAVWRWEQFKDKKPEG
jgi:hypothetical protein